MRPGRQIILYLRDVRSGEVYSFNYRLQICALPVQAQTMPSQVYDYYSTDRTRRRTAAAHHSDARHTRQLTPAN